MARRARRTIDRPDAFWDSSVLVLLCTQQRRTSDAKIMYAKFDLAVWWAAPVEIDSALARLSRAGEIASDNLAASALLAEKLAEEWSVISPSLSVRARASSLVYGYALRAADALQLSAALAWCENQPASRVFLTADAKLRQAARWIGFDTSNF